MLHVMSIAYNDYCNHREPYASICYQGNSRHFHSGCSLSFTPGLEFDTGLKLAPEGVFMCACESSLTFLTHSCISQRISGVLVFLFRK
jgi:hypothetical protein